MYVIFTHIYQTYKPNVGTYSIHEAHGYILGKEFSLKTFPEKNWVSPTASLKKVIKELRMLSKSWWRRRVALDDNTLSFAPLPLGT